MKKIIVVFIICLLLCGCGEKEEDKYVDFEHYSSKEFDNSNGDPVRYIFNNDREHNIYVVANITPTGSEMNLYGLLYKVGEDDYISLRKFYGETYGAYFYQDWKNDLNKLYIVNGGYFEYILDKEKVSSRKLNFNIPDVPEEMIKSYEKATNSKINYTYARIYGIKDVTPEFIYYRANLENLYRSVIIKCSLDNFNCEYDED